MGREVRFVIHGDTDIKKVPSLKQHINLSMYASQTIDEDRKAFSNGEDFTLGGILNRIFLKFHERADASIYERCQDKREEYEKLFYSKEFDAMDRIMTDAYIDKLVEDYKMALIKKSRSYEKGKSIKMNLNKDPLDALRMSHNAEYYEYGTIGLYLKAIFEEYAVKPMHEREAIIFSDAVEKINSAKDQKKRMKISYIGNGQRPDDAWQFYFMPYGIFRDKANLFNYAVGYSQRIMPDGTLDKWGIGCFRISRIGESSRVISKSFHLSKEERNAIERAMAEKGVAYLSGDIKEIKVRFTEEGLRQFHRHLFQRPNDYKVAEDTRNVYIFRCTVFQAEHYLFKFGKEAEVIEPVALRDRLVTRYHEAYLSYNK